MVYGVWLRKNEFLHRKSISSLTHTDACTHIHMTTHTKFFTRIHDRNLERTEKTYKGNY